MDANDKCMSDTTTVSRQNLFIAKHIGRTVSLALLLAVTPLAYAASPCDGVDRTLSVAQKTTLAPAIASQLHVPSVDVLQMFRLRPWRIVYVATHQSDNGFLFYAQDPLTHPAVTSWAGGAAPDEQASIRHWVLTHAHGIPSRLAECFAWHVTQHRDM